MTNVKKPVCRYFFCRVRVHAGIVPGNGGVGDGKSPEVVENIEVIVNIFHREIYEKSLKCQCTAPYPAKLTIFHESGMLHR
jgi:hypothetical protein